MRTLILLIYGTGAFCGEILRLGFNDANLDKRTLRFREKGARSRVVPIGHSLGQVLAKYATWRIRKKYFGSTFLITKYDQSIRVATVAKHFERLRRVSGILRHDGATFQPRLFDLRCTFAVHRISSWIKNGADLNRMPPALAAYMGQTGLGSTEKYLALTPARFQKDLDKLSPQRRGFHWRNDRKLMEFLSSL
jgi:integrase/recombinase XerD